MRQPLSRRGRWRKRWIYVAAFSDEWLRSVTGSERATTSASVVPQAPLPTMATRAGPSTEVGVEVIPADWFARVASPRDVWPRRRFGSRSSRHGRRDQCPAKRGAVAP